MDDFSCANEMITRDIDKFYVLVDEQNGPLQKCLSLPYIILDPDEFFTRQYILGNRYAVPNPNINHIRYITNYIKCTNRRNPVMIEKDCFNHVFIDGYYHYLCECMKTEIQKNIADPPHGPTTFKEPYIENWFLNRSFSYTTLDSRINKLITKKIIFKTLSDSVVPIKNNSFYMYGEFRKIVDPNDISDGDNVFSMKIPQLHRNVYLRIINQLQCFRQILVNNNVKIPNNAILSSGDSHSDLISFFLPLYVTGIIDMTVTGDNIFKIKVNLGNRQVIYLGDYLSKYYIDTMPSYWWAVTKNDCNLDIYNSMTSLFTHVMYKFMTFTYSKYKEKMIYLTGNHDNFLPATLPRITQAIFTYNNNGVERKILYSHAPMFEYRTLGSTITTELTIRDGFKVKLYLCDRMQFEEHTAQTWGDMYSINVNNDAEDFYEELGMQLLRYYIRIKALMKSDSTINQFIFGHECSISYLRILDEYLTLSDNMREFIDGLTNHYLEEKKALNKEYGYLIQLTNGHHSSDHKIVLHDDKYIWDFTGKQEILDAIKDKVQRDIFNSNQCTWNYININTGLNNMERTDSFFNMISRKCRFINPLYDNFPCMTVDFCNQSIFSVLGRSSIIKPPIRSVRYKINAMDRIYSLDAQGDVATLNELYLGLMCFNVEDFNNISVRQHKFSSYLNLLRHLDTTEVIESIKDYESEYIAQAKYIYYCLLYRDIRQWRTTPQINEAQNAKTAIAYLKTHINELLDSGIYPDQVCINYPTSNFKYCLGQTNGRDRSENFPTIYKNEFYIVPELISEMTSPEELNIDAEVSRLYKNEDFKRLFYGSATKPLKLLDMSQEDLKKISHGNHVKGACGFIPAQDKTYNYMPDLYDIDKIKQFYSLDDGEFMNIPDISDTFESVLEKKLDANNTEKNKKIEKSKEIEIKTYYNMLKHYCYHSLYYSCKCSASLNLKSRYNMINMYGTSMIVINGDDGGEFKVSGNYGDFFCIAHTSDNYIYHGMPPHTVDFMKSFFDKQRSLLIYRLWELTENATEDDYKQVIIDEYEQIRQRLKTFLFELSRLFNCDLVSAFNNTCKKVQTLLAHFGEYYDDKSSHDREFNRLLDPDGIETLQDAAEELNYMTEDEFYELYHIENNATELGLFAKITNMEKIPKWSIFMKKLSDLRVDKSIKNKDQRKLDFIINSLLPCPINDHFLYDFVMRQSAIGYNGKKNPPNDAYIVKNILNTHECINKLMQSDMSGTRFVRVLSYIRSYYNPSYIEYRVSNWSSNRITTSLNAAIDNVVTKTKGDKNKDIMNTIKNTIQAKLPNYPQNSTLTKHIVSIDNLVDISFSRVDDKSDSLYTRVFPMSFSRTKSDDRNYSVNKLYQLFANHRRFFAAICGKNRSDYIQQNNGINPETQNLVNENYRKLIIYMFRFLYGTVSPFDKEPINYTEVAERIKETYVLFEQFKNQISQELTLNYLFNNVILWAVVKANRSYICTGGNAGQTIPIRFDPKPNLPYFPEVYLVEKSSIYAGNLSDFWTDAYLLKIFYSKFIYNISIFEYDNIVNAIQSLLTNNLNIGDLNDLPKEYKDALKAIEEHPFIRSADRLLQDDPVSHTEYTNPWDYLNPVNVNYDYKPVVQRTSGSGDEAKIKYKIFKKLLIKIILICCLISVIIITIVYIYRRFKKNNDSAQEDTTKPTNNGSIFDHFTLRNSYL